MNIRKLTSFCAAAAMGVGLVVSASASVEAAMAPAPAVSYSNPQVQLADCLLGAHLGPLGACVGGGYHHRHCWIDRWGHRRCN
ncbi:MAG: hypothetical protein ABR970_17145 [Roseiarcus sp.]|jgi:hypothetical protein